MATGELTDTTIKPISRKRRASPSVTSGGDRSSPIKARMFDTTASPRKLPGKKRKIYIHKEDPDKAPSLLRLSSEVGVDLSNEFGSDDELDLRLPSFPRQRIEPIKSSPMKIPQFKDEPIKPKVKKIWRGHDIPQPMTRDQLDKAINRHMKAVERVLDPKKQAPRYYDQIKQIQLELTRETVRDIAEQWQFDWKQFYGGYIGPERQFYIGEKILAKYGDRIKQIRGDSVVMYLSEDNYVNYVLALELIVELVAEQLSITAAEAVEAIADTRDYGTEIADKVDFR